MIEIEMRIKILIDHQRRRRRRQQRVAVGIGFRRNLGADIAAGAGAVLDNHRLPPFARQPIGDDARHDVGGAAGGEGDHDFHRARRKILRLRRDGHGAERQRQSRQRPSEAPGQCGAVFRDHAFALKSSVGIAAELSQTVPQPPVRGAAT
jgi:hypothetical protein